MDMNDMSNVGPNLKKIAADNQMSAIVRMTAQQILKTPYMTLADFFKGLSNNDVTALSFMAEMGETNEDCLQDLMCLSIMLAHAEGAPPQNIDETVSNANWFISLIAIESLHRKGLVDVFRENMSFGADAASKKIVQLKNGINPQNPL